MKWLVKRIRDMSASIPKPRLGEWDVPSLLNEAADEIERLRKYAILLESGQVSGKQNVEVARQETQVNWLAIHGISP